MPPGDTLPETLVPRDDTKDTAFEVDAAILLRLNTIPIPTTTGMAQLSSFTDALSKDHVLKVLLAHDQHTNVLLIPEQDPDLISSVIAVLLYFFSGVSTTSRFNRCALLCTGSPPSFILRPTMHPTSDLRRPDHRMFLALGICSAQTNEPG